jgi:hypothetical protein
MGRSLKGLVVKVHENTACNKNHLIVLQGDKFLKLCTRHMILLCGECSHVCVCVIL